MAKAVFDELTQDPSRDEQLYRRHQRRRLAHQPRRRSRRSRSSRPRSCARCSTGWAPTARSAPTRTASRSSPRMPGCYAQGYFVYDSHKSGAQTISHLRFGPRADPRALSDRRGRVSSPATSSASSNGRTCCGSRRRARLSCSTARIGAGRDLGPPAALDAAADHRQEAAACSSSTPPRWRATSGLRGRTNTVLQTCFFAISGVLPREGAIRQIKKSIKKTYGRQGRGGGARAISRPSTTRWRGCSR